MTRSGLVAMQFCTPEALTAIVALSHSTVRMLSGEAGVS